MKKFAVYGLLLLAGCATKPQDIQASYVSETIYKSSTCEELRATLLNVNTALFNAGSQQENARANDTLGVMLVGLPVASMAGRDATAQVATLKGHAAAIERAGEQKKCGSLAPIIRWD